MKRLEHELIFNILNLGLLSIRQMVGNSIICLNLVNKNRCLPVARLATG